MSNTAFRLNTYSQLWVTSNIKPVISVPTIPVKHKKMPKARELEFQLNLKWTTIREPKNVTQESLRDKAIRSFNNEVAA